MSVIKLFLSLISHGIPCWRNPISRLVFVTVNPEFKWAVWITIVGLIVIMINRSSIIYVLLSIKDLIIVGVFFKLVEWIEVITPESCSSWLLSFLLGPIRRWTKIGRLLLHLRERLIRSKALEMVLTKVTSARIVLFQFCIYTLLGLISIKGVAVTFLLFRLSKVLNLVWILVITNTGLDSLYFGVTLVIRESFRVDPNFFLFIFPYFLDHIRFKILLFEALIIIRYSVNIVVFWFPNTHLKELILICHCVRWLFEYFCLCFLVSYLQSWISITTWKISLFVCPIVINTWSVVLHLFSLLLSINW